MKYGKFITSAEEIEYNSSENEYSAQRIRCIEAKKQAGESFFNSLADELPEGKGLLCFKKSFALSDNVKKAVVRSTALGVYDLFINGKRVGTSTSDGTVYDELKPEWTDYNFHVLEQEYDMTDLLENENTVIAVVSEGWWRGRISYGIYGKKPRAFCAEIEIEYADGRIETVSSDTDWQVCHGGRIRTASIWDGEYYDATRPDIVKEWDAYEWTDATLADYANMKIEKPYGSPVRIRKGLDHTPKSAVVYSENVDNGTDFGEIKPSSKKVGEGCEAILLKKGETMILDMCQEIVGCPELTLKAAKGTKLTVAFAELLNDSGDASRGNDGPKGSVYVKNYRSALSRLVYVASGDGTEIYRPTHTFYGYRYLSITATDYVEIKSVVGKVIGSEMTELGNFETSSAEINKLYSNIVWGMRGNYLSVPTDCPQRDERLGWTGDTQVFIGAANYMADTRAFMHKWMDDARYSQIGYDGNFGNIIPRVFGHKGHAVSACAWTDAGIIVPYKVWKMFKDKSILEENYDAIEEYMATLAKEGHEGPRPHYGDWLAYEATDMPYLSLAYYAYDISLMIKICEVLGKRDRVAHYKALLKETETKFTERYIVDGELTEKTQTAYLLALAFDLVSGDVKRKTIKQLREKIRDNGYKLLTGFVGTAILNQTLSKVGLDEEAYSLLMQYEDPSWLYSLRQGATTIWERWNSYTIEKGFGDVGMNSFNHYAYGAVAEWMYDTMAGIRPNKKNGGFKHFVLRPTPDNRKKVPMGQEKINYVKASYNSINGNIESSWERSNGRIIYKFTVPDGTDARVELIHKEDLITINNMVFSLKEIGAFKSSGRIVFKLSPGKYTIQ